MANDTCIVSEQMTFLSNVKFSGGFQFHIQKLMCYINKEFC